MSATLIFHGRRYPWVQLDQATVNEVLEIEDYCGSVIEQFPADVKSMTRLTKLCVWLSLKRADGAGGMVVGSLADLDYSPDDWDYEPDPAVKGEEASKPEADPTELPSEPGTDPA